MKAGTYHDSQGRTLQQCMEEAAEKYGCEVRVIRSRLPAHFTVHISAFTSHKNDLGIARTSENPFQALAEALHASQDLAYKTRIR
jgi:hypothetical protein